MSAAAVFVSILLAILGLRGIAPSERPYIGVLILAHVLGGVGQVVLFEQYYGYGDIEGFVLYGRLLSHIVEIDPVRFAPEIVKLVLHLPCDLPMESSADSTGTMVGLTGILMFFIGPVKTGSCIVVSLFSMLGQLSLYKRVRELVNAPERRTVLFGTLFVPSVIFWSSGLQKEAFAIAFLGFACSGAIDVLLRKRFVGGVVKAVGGAVGVALIKPYILFPLVLALGAWVFAASFKTRELSGRTIGYVVVAVAVAVVGVLALGRAFPSFSIDSVGSTAADLQRAGAGMHSANDSYVAVGDASEKSLAGQAQYFPLALFNTLFRPVILEVRGPVILAAAVEMTVIGVFLVRVLARLRDPRARHVIRTSPLVMFCVAFVVTFAVGVGIATTNMGTLSRYRMPMMPFYVTALLLIHKRTSNRGFAEVDESAGGGGEGISTAEIAS